MTSNKKRVRLSDIIGPAFYETHKLIDMGVIDEAVESGGRASLKSSYVGTEVVLQLVKHPDCHALVTRQVGDTMRESVYAQILGAIDELGLTTKFTCTQSPLQCTYLPTGQRILFRGLDDPQKIKSIKLPFGYIGILWFEEADQIKGGDGIGSKYENMAKSWGKIQDYSAVDNIERDEPDNNQEEYESQYTEEDIALLDRQEKENDLAAEAADAKRREQEALAELEKALAEARLRGQREVMPSETDSTATAAPPDTMTQAKGTIDEESRSVKAPAETDKASEVVKKVKTASDYFNTLAKDAREPKLIKAIIDENIKAVDGSRVRLRLLDDIEINESVVRRGTYLYATVSGFSSGRVKGSINSILVEDELVKVSLSIYDTDGLEGLYVPISQFRETSKDVASSAMSGSMNMNTSGYGNSLAQWGMQAVNKAYQKTSNAISKAIKKNKVKLKYGTFVYLVNGRENRN